MPLTAHPTITPADYDQGSGWTTTTIGKFVDATEHLKQVLYGDGSYVGAYPHDHDGAEDARVTGSCSGNLVRDWAPAEDATSEWTLSGLNWYAPDGKTDLGFQTTTTAGHSAYQCLHGQTSYRPMSSNGGDFVCSIHVRALDTLPTAGELWFGLSINAPTGYAASCKGVIAAADVTAAYKRFVMPLPGVLASAGAAISFMIKVGSTPMNQKLVVTACDVRVGQVLAKPSFPILEQTREHKHFQRYGLSDCPIYDHDVSATRAAFVTGA